MKHLYYVAATVLLPLLVSCHTKKQAIETVREEANTALKHLHVIDSARLDSISASFIAEFDSLVIEMPLPPTVSKGAGTVPDTATAPPRPVKATVYGGKVSTEKKSVSASSAHAQRADTLHTRQQRATDATSHSDTVALGKPPDMTIILIAIIVILAALVYLKFR